MRFVSYIAAGTEGFGYIDGDDVRPLSRPDGPTNLVEWLSGPRETGRPFGGINLRSSELTLLPPIPAPRQILCVAANFREANRPPVDNPYPVVFTRTAAAQVGHNRPILKPAETSRLDYEGELAVIIGRPGRRISRESAMTHVAGYACFNDGSVRDWQKHSSQFTPGKNFYQSGGFGPWLTSTDEVPDPYELHLETRVNGQIRQSIAMSAMIFRIDWLIAYLSTFTPLAAGDVILTGTPSGFGATRTPPEYLVSGDVVEVDIPGIGFLRNPIIDEDLTASFS